MWLKIAVIIAILGGGVLGIYFSDSQKDSIQREKILEEICEGDKNTEYMFETESEKRCVSNIANTGDNLTLSPKEVVDKVQERFFYKDFNIAKVRPEEYHIYLKKTKSGKIRNYDPRLDIFSRFKVTSFVKDNLTIKDYSVYPKKVTSVLESMKSIKCLEPKLSKIRNMDSLNFFMEYRSHQYLDKSKVKKIQGFDRKNFSAFQELDKKIGWYMYFVYNKNEISSFLLANHCNKSIALVLNHCIIDPRYDMQMEEIYWFEKNAKVGINIYCKSSHHKRWTLLNTKVLDKQ